MSLTLSAAVDAEECVIGSCLLNAPQAVEAVVHSLTPADFASPNRGAALAVIASLYSDGRAIDVLTVAEGLRVHGSEWEHATADLTTWMTSVPSIANVSHYIEVVVRYSAKRRLQRIGVSLANDAQDPGTDPTDLAERAKAELVAVDSPILGASPGDMAFDDFLALPEDELAPVVVPDLLTTDDRVVIVAPEGVGKSYLLAQLTVLPTWGLHPFRFHHKPIPPVRTLLVDLENPRHVVRKRLQGLVASCRHYAKQEREPGILWHRPGGIDLRKRADRAAFEDVLRRNRPSLVCLGPLYKAYQRKGTESDEQVAAELQAILDDLRTRYCFALVLEHHAPQFSGAIRELRPYGSSLWLRWPEFGLKLMPDKDRGKEQLNIGRWREDRVEVRWPDELHRGSPWPWVPKWNDDGGF